MRMLLKKIPALHALPLGVALFGFLLVLFPNVAHAWGVGDVLYGGLEWIASTASKGFVYVVVAPIAEVLAQFFGYLLILSSTIFEVILNATVIGFGATLAEYGILDGIRLVWSAFRDIANIVIIGMFVFVAISMILGNMSYGTKKFVAKILIVAVLINFSLLFTQLIVDASHIAATQFYKGIRAAAVNNSPAFQEVDQSGGEQAFDTAWNRQGGVAGAFINKMGISGFGDTYRLVAKAGTQEGLAVAVFYSLTMIALLIATSAVFLYGAYLLTARAILLIVLLATAALAFAAWLVPKYGEGKYGWDGWLTTLIQTSVFAPLLMILLWASIVILSKAQLNKAETSSVGAFLQNPTGGGASASSAIVVYLFTLGMLFLSFKIASSFSHKITGFSMALNATNLGLRGLGSTVGVVGRFGARNIAKPLDKRYGDALARVGYNLNTSPSIGKALAKFGSKALTSGVNSSFNPNLIGAAIGDKYKDVVKKYGLDTGGKGGVVAADKRTEENEKKAREEAHKAFETRNKVTDKERKEMLETALKSKPPAEKQKYDDQSATMKKALIEQEKTRKELEQIRKQEAPGRPLSAADQERVGKMETKLNEGTERIRKAQEDIQEFESKLVKEVEERLKEKEKLNVLERFGDDVQERAQYSQWKNTQQQKRRKKEWADALVDKKDGPDDGDKKSPPSPSGAPKKDKDHD